MHLNVGQHFPLHTTIFFSLAIVSYYFTIYSSKVTNRLKFKRLQYPETINEISTLNKTYSLTTTSHKIITISKNTTTTLSLDAVSKNQENTSSSSKFTSSNGFSTLIYNRVPKCGSTTMKQLLLHLKGTKARPRFVYNDICYPKEPHWIRFNTKNEKKDVQDFKRYTSKVRQTQKVLYVRHTYFVDDMKPNVYKYINMVKHPVDQFISWFYYERHGWVDTPLAPAWTHDVEKGTRNLTIQECISGSFESCKNPSKHSEFFGYFCGHHDFCFEAGSEEALQQSRQNIESKFIAIGLTSEFENSLKLYETVLPKWFEGMYKYYSAFNNFCPALKFGHFEVFEVKFLAKKSIFQNCPTKRAQREAVSEL